MSWIDTVLLCPLRGLRSNHNCPVCRMKSEWHIPGSDGIWFVCNWPTLYRNVHRVRWQEAEPAIRDCWVHSDEIGHETSVIWSQEELLAAYDRTLREFQEVDRLAYEQMYAELEERERAATSAA